MLQVMLNSCQGDAIDTFDKLIPYKKLLHPAQEKEGEKEFWVQSKIGLAIGETEAHKSPNVPGDKDVTEEEI